MLSRCCLTAIWQLPVSALRSQSVHAHQDFAVSNLCVLPDIYICVASASWSQVVCILVLPATAYFFHMLANSRWLPAKLLAQALRVTSTSSFCFAV